MSIGSLSIPSHFTIKGCSVNETGTSSPGWALLNLSKLQSGPSRGRNLSRRFRIRNGDGGFVQNLHGVGVRDGIIIVDHGSRRKESNVMLNEFVAMFREKTGYQIVEPAHMELAEPSIRDSFNACIQQGAKRVIISPFFLFPGRHWHQDIPSLTAEAAKEHPHVSYIVTAPLGLHELLVDVVNDRIKYCLSHVAGDADECSVCAGTRVSSSTVTWVGANKLSVESRRNCLLKDSAASKAFWVFRSFLVPRAEVEYGTQAPAVLFCLPSKCSSQAKSQCAMIISVCDHVESSGALDMEEDPHALWTYARKF